MPNSKIAIIVTAFILIISYIFLFNKKQTTLQAKQTRHSSIYDIPITFINGKQETMETFKNKTILIVNVASKCGFTDQYTQLEELQKKYQNKNFSILAVPSNDFMNQEPGSNQEILSFCKNTYDATFPLLEKAHVKQSINQHPLYKFLITSKPFGKKISWNFNKYLISKEGRVIGYFGSTTKPLSEKIVSLIEEDIKK